jgi:hypothetical protein
VVKEGIIPDGSVALPLAPLNLSKLKADDNNQRLRIEIVRKTWVRGHWAYLVTCGRPNPLI